MALQTEGGTSALSGRKWPSSNAERTYRSITTKQNTHGGTMRKWIVGAAFVAAAFTALGTGGVASADSTANSDNGMRTSGAFGLLSGTQIAVPITAPINISGNALALFGRAEAPSLRKSGSSNSGGTEGLYTTDSCGCFANSKPQRRCHCMCDAACSEPQAAAPQAAAPQAAAPQAAAPVQAAPAARTEMAPSTSLSTFAAPMLVGAPLRISAQ